MSESATERLRRLLDERGVEWEDGDAAYEIEWSTPDGRRCSAMYWKPTFSVLISHCTPEQAIAATLGGGKLTAEQVRKAANGHYELRIVLDVDGFDVPQLTFDWQAIADELNAALGGGECENANKNGYGFRFECSKCGYSSITTNCRTRNDELPKFCPSCGKHCVHYG